MNKVELALLEHKNIDEIVVAFKKIGWNKPRKIYTEETRQAFQQMNQE